MNTINTNNKLNLIKATIDDSVKIHQMQIKAFAKLLAKYQDYETNPGNEKIEKIKNIILNESNDYLLIVLDDNMVGAIRIENKNNGNILRISPIFIIPEYQNRGIAQKVFSRIEKEYKPKEKWILNTILEEVGNCYVYEKVGYKKTGQIEKIKENMHLVYYEKKIN